MVSLLDIDILEPAADEAVEVLFVWKELYKTEIASRLRTPKTNFTDSIIGVYVPSEFGEKYHNNEEVVSIIQGSIESSIVVEGIDISYNTIRSTINTIENSVLDVVVVNHFDSIPNKKECSQVDTFLLEGLEELWRSGTIKIVILLSYSDDNFSLLPQRYYNISRYGDIKKVLP